VMTRSDLAFVLLMCGAESARGRDPETIAATL
jgi:hypothetical protein